MPADPWSVELLADRYRLGAKIGSGGMADVYEGVDTRLRRPVAVKVFRPGPGADAQTEDSLSTEALLLARLHDPGLVTVYDVGQHDERPFLVMQLVDGPTLRGLLSDGPLPERRVADLGAALAQALAHVHQAGIVHRDVKPSNVLLDPAGAPHLADFGIARLVDATRHTASDVLTGTAAYLAPEQVEGKRIGPAADVYALGLVLLECLKGEPEYEGAFLEAAIARVHRPPVVPAGLSPDLASLLRAMTDQDPGARPDAARCATVLDALETHAAAETHAAPGSLAAPGTPGTPGTPAGAPRPAPSPPVTPHPSRSATSRPTGRDRDPHGTLRAKGTAVTRTSPRPAPRHSRRLAVSTVLAALSVALGATVAVAPGTDPTRDDPTSTAAAPADRPSGTADTPAPDDRRTAAPRTDSRTVPASTDPEPSGRAAPAHRGMGRQKDAAPSDTAPGRPQHAADNAGTGKPAHPPTRNGHG
ncbi:serine/threonine-protein kinase [Streptomyces abyssomicinicus]|uniref:serine/threonine-protein kinase n=1 Tax=Streptomyces abyssomicinicus TaxID=574929 RepID=UPI001FEAEF96|nr:serine/threonine-protein kinase [Streptomyces abyssomicinicus]